MTRGNPQSTHVQTVLKEHERDALNEYLREQRGGLTRYKFMRALVIGKLVEEGYLELIGGGTIEYLNHGYAVPTKYVEAEPEEAS
jgi:hypothetical protein